MIKEQAIVDFLTTIFETVLVANGFHTSAGDNVFYDEAEEIPKKKIPAINFRLADNQPEESTSNTFIHTINQDLEVDMIGLTPEEVTEIYADVLKIIGQNLTLNGLAISVKRGNTYNEPTDQQGNKVADRRLVVTIKYRTNAWSEE